jgi:hypothetical protein
MRYLPPKNILNQNEVILVIDTDVKTAALDDVKKLKTLDVKKHIAAKHIPVWADQSLYELMKMTQFRQLLIVYDTPNIHATGLVMMGLQKGLTVYFACPAPSVQSPFRLKRLQQAGAVVMSLEDAISELATTKALE